MPLRHIPERTCVACRSPRPKRELVRVVRAPDGTVTVDDTGKKSGRGAYLCRRAGGRGRPRRGGNRGRSNNNRRGPLGATAVAPTGGVAVAPRQLELPPM